MSANTEIDADLLETGGIQVERRTAAKGTVITITLRRERALNALTSQTFHALHAVLDSVPSTPTQLVITGAGRSFSAGGDVRALRKSVLEAGALETPARIAAARHILQIEYKFLTRLYALGAQPHLQTIAIADGYAFGSGQGLFQACRQRLVSPRALLSMPECRIGLVPDCGASWFLPRLPGSVGMFAALTGTRVCGGDAVALGLADGLVAAGWRGESCTGCELGIELQKLTQVSNVADATSDMRRGIDDCFGLPSLDAILAAVAELASRGTDWATVAQDDLKKGAPGALRETFRTLTEGFRGGGLDHALERELEADSVLAATWDFEEGVRAALVDKDGKPVWRS